MIRGLATALTLLLATTAVSGVEREDFDEVVAFEQSLKTLSMSVRRGENPVPDDRLLLLDGVVATVEVINAEEATFEAQLELVSGEWRGLEEVVMYSVYVTVRGPEFASRIPVRRRGPLPPDAVTANTAVVVVGRYTGATVDEEGIPVPVIEAFHIRPVQ